MDEVPLVMHHLSVLWISQGIRFPGFAWAVLQMARNPEETREADALTEGADALVVTDAACLFGASVRVLPVGNQRS